jgi:hypothetical protein
MVSGPTPDAKEAVELIFFTQIRRLKRLLIQKGTIRNSFKVAIPFHLQRFPPFPEDSTERINIDGTPSLCRSLCR